MQTAAFGFMPYSICQSLKIVFRCGMIGFFHHVSNGLFDGGLVFETLLTHLYIIGVLLSRTDTGFQDMIVEVQCHDIRPLIYIDRGFSSISLSDIPCGLKH